MLWLGLLLIWTVLSFVAGMLIALWFSSLELREREARVARLHKEQR